MTPIELVGVVVGAALLAALGPLLASDAGPEDRVVGLATALAAGGMLGVSYPLLRDGLDGAAVAASLGAAGAVVLLFLAHVFFDIDGDGGVPPSRAFTAAAVHAAPEGLALGVACALDARFGLIVGITLALHNVGEGVALATLLGRTVSRARAAVLATASNLPQVALGVAGFGLAGRYPAVQPALMGAAGGALVYLSLSDLLPAGYRAAGRTAISVVVIAATGLAAFAGALR